MLRAKCRRTVALLSPLAIVFCVFSEQTVTFAASAEEQKRQELRESVHRLLRLVITNEPDDDRRRVVNHINENLGFGEDKLPAGAYFAEVLRASALHPDSRFWLVVTDGAYGSPAISKSAMAAIALQMYDPHDGSDLSRVCHQVLRYVESGVEAGIGWSNKHDRNWFYFKSHLQDNLHRNNGEFDEPLRHLVVFMMRADQQRTFRLLLDFNTVAVEQTQELAKLERAIDDCLWLQQYKFISEEASTFEATDAIKALAGHEQWWARLFALQMMIRQPEFFSLTQFTRLENDTADEVAKEAQQFRREIRERYQKPPSKKHPLHAVVSELLGESVLREEG